MGLSFQLVMGEGEEERRGGVSDFRSSTLNNILMKIFLSDPLLDPFFWSSGPGPGPGGENDRVRAGPGPDPGPGPQHWT